MQARGRPCPECALVTHKGGAAGEAHGNFVPKARRAKGCGQAGRGIQRCPSGRRGTAPRRSFGLSWSDWRPVAMGAFGEIGEMYADHSELIDLLLDHADSPG